MNSRNIKIIGGIIIGIIAIIGVFLVVVPLVTAATNSPEIAAAQQQNSRLQKQVQDLSKLKGQSTQLNTIRTQLVRQFPTAANVPDLINLISLAANNAGINPNNISSFNFSAPMLGTAAPGASGASGAATTAATSAPAAATPAPGATAAAGATATSQYASLGVSLTIKGNSAQFAKFMQSITSLRRVFTISNFGISGQGNDATLTITGQTYLYRDIPTPGATTAATATAAAQ